MPSSNVITEKQMQQIDEAALILKNGGIVAFPTETVYGLGADATNLKAVRKVYEVKQRPLNHPVIVHLSDFSQISNWAENVSTHAKTLMTHFWPGPLTLILKRTKNVPDEITGGQNTVALRMPAHPIALALLNKTECPLVAPSANRFGQLSPTHSDHVKQELGSRVDFVIEGGYCDVGIESTILDISSKEPRILRPGAITPSQIEQVLNIKLSELKTPASIRVPGDLAQHYAPRAQLIIVPADDLVQSIYHFRSNNKTVAVLSQKPPLIHDDGVFWFKMPELPEDYMRMLYHSLFLADQKKPWVILAQMLPYEEAWMAIRDRMMKAAA